VTEKPKGGLGETPRWGCKTPDRPIQAKPKKKKLPKPRIFRGSERSGRDREKKKGSLGSVSVKKTQAREIWKFSTPRGKLVSKRRDWNSGGTDRRVWEEGKGGGGR